MKLRSALLLATILLLTCVVRADEGMWLLPLIKKYNLEDMKQKGYYLDDKYIYSETEPSLKDAVVRFGRGCTGEFISYKGLILTNHHCGYDAIQKHSSLEHDYLKDGFWAKTLADEIPTPGLTVAVLVRMQDVTDLMVRATSDTMDMFQLEKAMKLTRDSIIKAATDSTTYTAQIKPFYDDNRYYLLVYNIFRDVRMVGAPPSSIGKFGGETDNWMYPRHTGDFSLFRVYADKNNQPADYSPDNVPYQPKKAITVSVGGYEEGSFAMIIGNPGRTERYMSSWELKRTIEIDNRARAEVRAVKLAVWKKHMDADPAVRIQYASKYAASSNYWKNSIGQTLAIAKLGVVKQKEDEEKAFFLWVGNDTKRYEKYKDVLKEVKESNELVNTTQLKQQFGTETFYRGIEFISYGTRFTGLRTALEKKDTTALNKYKRLAQTPLNETFYKDYNMPTDRETAKALLKYFKENLPDSIHPPIYQTIAKDFKGDIDAYLDKLYATSFLTDYNRWVAFLKKPSTKKLDEDLGFLATEAIQTWMHEDMIRTMKYASMLGKAMMHYTEARLEMMGDKPTYPDANSTLRLTYGTVQGYSPRDGVRYNHYTTIDGIIEKDDPQSSEFAVPEKLKELHSLGSYERYANEKGELPITFITNNDITGGNSGSPVFNRKGHLIGCAFDGNWEALSGDIAFEKQKQRSINVDIRYVLFIIHKYAACTRLLDEMQIVKD